MVLLCMFYATKAIVCFVPRKPLYVSCHEIHSIMLALPTVFSLRFTPARKLVGAKEEMAPSLFESRWVSPNKGGSQQLYLYKPSRGRVWLWAFSLILL